MREATVETVYGHSGEPYMTRAIWGRLRLQIFHRPDEGYHLHDHPSDFWTFPLVSYWEEYRDADGKLRMRKVHAFRLHHRKAEFSHRILGSVTKTGGLNMEGQIATIVWWGKKRREWGFHTEKGWFHWRHYFGLRGRA